MLQANAIPLIPTLVLALVSIVCSFYGILRIILPVLPPHPFSRRVSPVSYAFIAVHAPNLVGDRHSLAYPRSALCLSRIRVNFG